MLIAILMSVFSRIMNYSLSVFWCLSIVCHELFYFYYESQILLSSGWYFFQKRKYYRPTALCMPVSRSLPLPHAYVCSALISLCQFALAQTGFFLTILFHWVFRCLSSVQIYYDISLLKLFNLKSKPHLTSSK